MKMTNGRSAPNSNSSSSVNVNSSLQWTVTDGTSTFLFQSFMSALAYADGLARNRSAVKVIDTKSNTIFLNQEPSSKWLDISGIDEQEESEQYRSA
jgi:hypothetical protein